MEALKKFDNDLIFQLNKKNQTFKIFEYLKLYLKNIEIELHQINIEYVYINA